MNDAFRFTVIVDVVEDDRLCMSEDVPPVWNKADEYCFEGDGAHMEAVEEAWADNGAPVKTSVGGTVLIEETPGAGNELDRVLIDDGVRNADAPADEVLLGEVRVDEDLA